MNHLTIDQLRALADKSIEDTVPVPDQFKDGTPYHAFLYNLAQALDPDLIVELGTGREARGAAHFATGAPRAKVITIDTAEHIEPFPYSNVEFWRLDTRLAGAGLLNLNIPIGILFIDSEHTTAQALVEYRLYSSLVEKSGIILFDDINVGGMEGLWSQIPEPKFTHEGLHPPQGFGLAIKE